MLVVSPVRQAIYCRKASSVPASPGRERSTNSSIPFVPLLPATLAAGQTPLLRSQSAHDQFRTHSTQPILCRGDSTLRLRRLRVCRRPDLPLFSHHVACVLLQKSRVPISAWDPEIPVVIPTSLSHRSKLGPSGRKHE